MHFAPFQMCFLVVHISFPHRSHFQIVFSPQMLHAVKFVVLITLAKWFWRSEIVEYSCPDLSANLFGVMSEWLQCCRNVVASTSSCHSISLFAHSIHQCITGEKNVCNDVGKFFVDFLEFEFKVACTCRILDCHHCCFIRWQFNQSIYHWYQHGHLWLSYLLEWRMALMKFVSMHICPWVAMVDAIQHCNF